MPLPALDRWSRFLYPKKRWSKFNVEYHRLLLVIWWILSWYKWKHTRDSFGEGSRLQRFDYSELSIATGRFAKEKEIGKGGFGVVYSGILKNKEVAVKSIVKDSRGEFKDFLAELGAIDGTGHVNLVRLEGWGCNVNNYMFSCLYKQTINLFLIYELVPNGNLHQHLYENTEVLSWAMRYICNYAL
jgi:serine/threonine protein kinase